MKFTYKNIIEIHAKIADKYAINPDYFNINAIKSIVCRMNDNFNNMDIYPTVYDKAAVLFERIMRCHTFIDGNKRTAIESLTEYLFDNNIVYLPFPSDIRFSLEIAKIHSNNTDESHILKNIKKWIIFHSANCHGDINCDNGINIIINKQIALIKKIIYIAENKNRHYIIGKTFDYWFATDIYPYYTSYNDLEDIIKKLEMEKVLLKNILKKFDNKK